MDKLVIEYTLTAVEVILACILIGSIIAVYTSCHIAASVYKNDVNIREQQELYSEYAKYDEKIITDTEVLSLLAKGVNLPEGIKLYESENTNIAFKSLKCNETLNIGNVEVLSQLREFISAGTNWYSTLVINSNNGEVSFIELKKLNV